MPNYLQNLIERARKYVMSPEEKAEQMRSFAYGNTHLANDSITRSDIDEAVETLQPVKYVKCHCGADCDKYDPKVCEGQVNAIDGSLEKDELYDDIHDCWVEIHYCIKHAEEYWNS